MSAPREPADQAARRRAREDLKSSLLVEAGAGTGKTTVLLDRVEELLKTDISLDAMAIITFTEKAAGELKVKLRRRLEAAIAKVAEQGAWSEHLRRCLESLDRATVCTIHSFAAALLRERPVEAQVDPRFVVADELTTTMLMERTWDRWLEQQMAAGSPVLARALRLDLSPRLLRGLAFDLARQRDVEPGPAPPGGGEAAAARAAVVEGTARLVELSAACPGREDRGLRQIRDLAAALPALRAAEGDRLTAALERLPLKASAGSQSAWKPPSVLAEVKNLVAALAEARDAAVTAERSRAAHEVAAWLRDGFLHAYRTEKEARRLLDFTDLLILCRDMLRDSQAARMGFQERFACLLVDEFQDTDPLQSEILFLLAADDPAVSDWRAARPRPGKLFVVGDPKQSIYRFRRADIETYAEVKRLLVGQHAGEQPRLTQNFRTVPSIASWVNDLFGEVMGAGEGAVQPAYEPLAAARAEPGEGPAGPRVRLLVPRDPASLAEAGAAVERLEEARHVVALLKEARASWPAGDGGEGGLRWSDMALLFRTSAALEAYEHVLRDHEVPYRVSGGKRYYLRAEMRALQAVLAAVDGPHDPHAVVSALRCPIFGHSDEDLLAHAAGRRDWVYTRDGTARGTVFERSFDLLSRLHALRNARPVAATVEDLFESTGALSLFYLKPDGDQRAANLLKAIDLARAHDGMEGGPFGAFVRWLAGMASAEREEGEAPLAEESEPEQDEAGPGAVRIFTIHKAKGLEFPLVVLCDSSAVPRSEAPRWIVERGEGIARLEFRVTAGERRFESWGYARAAQREKRRLEAEADRLFYVAATRARDHLIVPLFGGKREGGMLACLRRHGFVPAHPWPARHRGAAVMDGGTLDVRKAAPRPFRLPKEDPVPPDPAIILEKEAWHRALKVALGSPTVGRAFRTASAMEASPPVLPAGGQDAAAASRDLGTAVHAVLERIDLATGRDIGLLSEEEAGNVGRPGLATQVRQLVEKALASRVIQEALAAPRHFKEVPFVLAGDAFLSEGQCDLVYESGGAFTIVDFKTDAVATEAEIDARAETYRPQAMVYARALGQVAGLPVSRVVLLFLRPGVERVLKVDETFLRQARRLLEG
ncbi:MAG TPA: UvrD-helicase domain-containing protein [Candidatus Polarisedimenticolia bacterium]|nr:UvrD-helicase domain-containing protein [Candidatus Polarisedimenticolia bacterium]